MITQVCSVTGTVATLQSFFSKRWVRAVGVLVLLAVLEGQLLYSVRQESLSWDEGDHIFAGYMMRGRALPAWRSSEARTFLSRRSSKA